MTVETKPKGVKRLLNALKYSMQGIRAAVRTEEAFRHELLLSVVLIPLAFFVGHTSTEKVLLIASILFVFIVELLNTAIERAIDRISYERHELSKESKDMASAAVMFSVILMVLTWAIIIFD